MTTLQDPPTTLETAPTRHSRLRTWVAAVAELLKATPAIVLVVEGNCDERGTNEYNISLGERRALAVREQLIALGVDGARVQTVSYGEERPVDAGHDENAWVKNRRADFAFYRR